MGTRMSVLIRSAILLPSSPTRMRGGAIGCEGANAASTIGSSGGATLVLGRFETRDEAVKAFCDNVVPGSAYNSTSWGWMAKMKYDGQLHGIFNAPSCNLAP